MDHIGVKYVVNVPKKEIANPDHNPDHPVDPIGNEDIRLHHLILLEVQEDVKVISRKK